LSFYEVKGALDLEDQRDGGAVTVLSVASRMALEARSGEKMMNYVLQSP
jgi:hypothetical protein